MRTAKYPGYRTMTGTQRRNARMEMIFADAYARAKAEGRRSPWDRADEEARRDRAYARESQRIDERNDDEIRTDRGGE